MVKNLTLAYRFCIFGCSKTSVSNCGPNGCDMQALRFATANRRACNCETKFSMKHRCIMYQANQYNTLCRVV